MTYPHDTVSPAVGADAQRAAALPLNFVVVKCFAHRHDMLSADKIIHEILEVQRHGARKTFTDWIDLQSYSLARSMLHDPSIERVTVIGTDGSGCLLYGIRKLSPPSLQLPLEF